jgi:hypothetical protein
LSSCTQLRRQYPDSAYVFPTEAYDKRPSDGCSRIVDFPRLESQPSASPQDERAIRGEGFGAGQCRVGGGVLSAQQSCVGQVSQRLSIARMADEIFGQPSRSLGIATDFAVSDRRGEGIDRIAMRRALCFGRRETAHRKAL